MTGEITYVGFGAEDQTPHAWVDVRCEFWAYCHKEERPLIRTMERPLEDPKPKEVFARELLMRAHSTKPPKSGP